MAPFHALYCQRCWLLDQDPFGRTCTECRTVERETLAKRIAAVRAAPLTRRVIVSRYLSSHAETVGGEVSQARAAEDVRRIERSGGQPR